jgi:hypothetical protein
MCSVIDIINSKTNEVESVHMNEFPSPHPDLFLSLSSYLGFLGPICRVINAIIVEYCSYFSRLVSASLVIGVKPTDKVKLSDSNGNDLTHRLYISPSEFYWELSGFHTAGSL